MKTKRITIAPIGFVENNVEKKQQGQKWQEVRSKIVIKPRLSEALDGIEKYSHIIVIFWMHKVSKKDRSLKKAIPYDLNNVPPVGILATRMYRRPNPIGISIVRLLKRKNNILEVEGLDAFNNSPVLDIKPYNAHPKDLVINPEIPDWEKEYIKKQE